VGDEYFYRMEHTAPDQTKLHWLYSMKVVALNHNGYDVQVFRFPDTELGMNAAVVRSKKDRDFFLKHYPKIRKLLYTQVGTISNNGVFTNISAGDHEKASEYLSKVDFKKIGPLIENEIFLAQSYEYKKAAEESFLSILKSRSPGYPVVEGDSWKVPRGILFYYYQCTGLDGQTVKIKGGTEENQLDQLLTFDRASGMLKSLRLNEYSPPFIVSISKEEFQRKLKIYGYVD